VASSLGDERVGEPVEEEKKRKGELQSMEGRIMQREESLDRRNDALDKRERQLSGLQSQLDRRKNDLDALEGKQTTELERIAGLSKDEAHDELIARVRAESVRDEAQILRESEQNVRAKADKTAREIISTAIQRCAADQAGEITVTTVHIPSDDLKGRIIGREGRNIRTFEQVSGVSLVIDDTPETVVLSSFDPVRRETARVALENLIADGRIHPARIEELYKKAEDLVNERVREAGEQAAFDAGIHDLHPEIVKTLGALKYRTSFGQNVLSHSIQVSALCGIMASELGLDPAPAKRAGLLHDIGKAIDHEVEGPHAVIGADLARRYGERPRSCTPSRHTMPTSIRILSSTSSCRRPMPSLPHVLVPVVSLQRPTSSALRSSRRSLTPMRESSAPTPCRLAASSM
jgi:ribonuclease Y